MPCLWIAIRLKARGASGSPSISVTLTPALSLRPTGSANTSWPFSAPARSAIGGEWRMRRSVGASHALPLASISTTPSIWSVLHRQLLHRMRDPAGARLFGTRQHALALAQRRHPGAALALDDAHARRGGGVLRRPRIGNRDRLAILDVDDTQHGHLRQSAHLVIGGPASVDQAFVGHVAQQRLELDLFLTLEAEGARDLPLAGRRGRILDELKDLLASGQAGLRLGTVHRSEVDSGISRRREDAKEPVCSFTTRRTPSLKVPAPKFMTKPRLNPVSLR